MTAGSRVDIAASVSPSHRVRRNAVKLTSNMAEKQPHEMIRAEFQRTASASRWDTGNIFGSLYREETGRETDNPFFVHELPDVSGAYGGPIFGYHGVQFDNSLHVADMKEASRKLLGADVYPNKASPDYVAALPGRRTDAEAKILAADKQVADAARKAGYDAIVTTHSVGVLNKARLPEPEPATYEEGELLGHRRFIERAIREGKTIPPEVLNEYPDLKDESQTRRLTDVSR
jgi:hypothetical protein